MDTDNRDGDFETRLLGLKLDVDKIMDAMQRESEQAARAVDLYPQAKQLCNRLLGQAAGHQAKAANLSRRLDVCRQTLKVLQQEAQTLTAGDDTDRAKSVRRDLQEIAETIRNWSTTNDGLGLG